MIHPTPTGKLDFQKILKECKHWALRPVKLTKWQHQLLNNFLMQAATSAT